MKTFVLGIIAVGVLELVGVVVFLLTSGEGWWVYPPAGFLVLGTAYLLALVLDGLRSDTA